MATLGRVARSPDGPGGARTGRDHRPRPAAVPCLWSRLPDSRRGGWCVQGPLQSRRRPPRSVWLRRRRAVRSDREEAVLPRAAWRPGVQLRHARMRPPLLVLPELGDLAGAARSASRGAPRDVDSRRTVADASRLGARAVVSTYNEPLITSEWAVAIFKQARAAGLMTAFVSNGNGTPRVLELSAALGGSLQGRPQGLRRPPLSAARRPARARARDDPARCTRWGSGSRS